METFAPPFTGLASLSIFGRPILIYGPWSYNQDRLYLLGWVQDTHEHPAQRLTTWYTTCLASVNIVQGLFATVLSLESSEETPFLSGQWPILRLLPICQ